MSLHDRIMSIPVQKEVDNAEPKLQMRSSIFVLKDAAQVAAEADELMAEMAEAIEVMLETGFDDQCEIVFDKYKAWKESTK